MTAITTVILGRDLAVGQDAGHHLAVLARLGRLRHEPAEEQLPAGGRGRAFAQPLAAMTAEGRPTSSPFSCRGSAVTTAPPGRSSSRHPARMSVKPGDQTGQADTLVGEVAGTAALCADRTTCDQGIHGSTVS
jgi:hypothetical protein